MTDADLGHQRLAIAVIKTAVEDLAPADLHRWLADDIFAAWCRVALCDADAVRREIVRRLLPRDQVAWGDLMCPSSRTSA